MEHIISIRVPFPPAIRRKLQREKNRFVAQYGSSYKSEPHITLYLGRYTQQGFSKLIRDLRLIQLQCFTISLLKPKMISQRGLRGKFFFVDVSNKRKLFALHAAILPIATRYRTSLLRKKDQQRLREGLYYREAQRKNLIRYGYADALQLFKPHITLGGAVGIHALEPVLTDVQKNLKSITGKKITVSSFTAMLYTKKNSSEGAKLTDRATIRLL